MMTKSHFKTYGEAMIIAKENISLKEEFLTTPEHLPRIKRDEALKYYNNKLKEFWRENGYEDEATTKRGKREAKSIIMELIDEPMSEKQKKKILELYRILK